MAAARADGASEPERLEVGYLPGAVGLLMGDVLRAFASRALHRVKRVAPRPRALDSPADRPVGSVIVTHRAESW